jgi:hypothetical protein
VSYLKCASSQCEQYTPRYVRGSPTATSVGLSQTQTNRSAGTANMITPQTAMKVQRRMSAITTKRMLPDAGS